MGKAILNVRQYMNLHYVQEMYFSYIKVARAKMFLGVVCSNQINSSIYSCNVIFSNLYTTESCDFLLASAKESQIKFNIQS